MAVSNPLYHDIILEHYEYPRNKGTCVGADATSRGANAACGDDLLVSLRLEGEHLGDVCWDGHACAIGEASASMMTEAVGGGERPAARTWIRTVRGMVTGRADEMDASLELGDLESLEGIRQYPVRVKCALLAWEALDEALSIAEQKKGLPSSRPT
jgi:nitrogen fixation NifU-like protein